ncbi:hypothetical protein KPB2_5354 [Klebsiella pneumoniae Kb677]|nr:hypothetical protein KPB2_5354 [Klebsiella pneumoniae Kb677]
MAGPTHPLVIPAAILDPRQVGSSSYVHSRTLLEAVPPHGPSPVPPLAVESTPFHVASPVTTANAVWTITTIAGLVQQTAFTSVHVSLGLQLATRLEATVTVTTHQMTATVLDARLSPIVVRKLATSLGYGGHPSTRETVTWPTTADTDTSTLLPSTEGSSLPGGRNALSRRSVTLAILHTQVSALVGRNGTLPALRLAQEVRRTTELTRPTMTTHARKPVTGVGPMTSLLHVVDLASYGSSPTSSERIGCEGAHRHTYRLEALRPVLLATAPRTLLVAQSRRLTEVAVRPSWLDAHPQRPSASLSPSRRPITGQETLVTRPANVVVPLTGTTSAGTLALARWRVLAGPSRDTIAGRYETELVYARTRRPTRQRWHVKTAGGCAGIKLSADEPSTMRQPFVANDAVSLRPATTRVVVRLLLESLPRTSTPAPLVVTPSLVQRTYIGLECSLATQHLANTLDASMATGVLQDAYLVTATQRLVVETSSLIVVPVDTLLRLVERPTPATETTV